MGRTYTLAYKTRILAELDAASKGEKGVILLREGLYFSTVSRWRDQREAGNLAGKKRSPRPDEARQELVSSLSRPSAVATCHAESASRDASA